MDTTLTHSNPPLDKVLKKISRLLAQKEPGRVRQLFSLAQNKGVLTGLYLSPGFLKKTMGPETAQELLRVLASYPCPYCKKGRVRCQACKGHGHHGYTQICEECFSFGSVRCEWCDGSGWLALEDLPPILQPTIMIYRAQNALKRLPRFMQNSRHSSPTAESRFSLACLARYVAFLDRYMGVLENTIVARQKLNHNILHNKHRLDRIVRDCIEAGEQARAYLTDVLECLQETARREAETPDKNSNNSTLNRARAEFFSSQGDIFGLAGGFIAEHPFLEDATRKLKHVRR